MDRLITSAELFRKTERELSGLFHTATKVLAQTARDSSERRNALACLENIAQARAFVMVCRP